ncbi:MAG: dihydropteroate synthase [Pseudomonadota bacterium]
MSLDFSDAGIVFAHGPVLIMGVLNVTPDSFSDGGRFDSTAAACAQAQAMLAAGADLIDIGGESTRPGASPVSADEEMNRVIPVIEALMRETSPVISIDTSKAEVMQAAVAAGAAMINDVWALRQTGALAAAAALDVPVCLMHMQGSPDTMQRDPRYACVVNEVHAFLQTRIQLCEQAGIARERLLVDPGFGFGKRLDDNLVLLRDLGRFRDWGVPVLAGLSRKSMLGEITGHSTDQRLIGSVILAAEAARRGASIVRVHDVEQTREALQVAAAIGDHPIL